MWHLKEEKNNTPFLPIKTRESIQSCDQKLTSLYTSNISSANWETKVTK
jgi:hypothetical protein